MATPANDNSDPPPGTDPIRLARAVRVTVPEGWQVQVVHGETFAVELLVDLADHANPFVPSDGEAPRDTATAPGATSPVSLNQLQAPRTDV